MRVDQVSTWVIFLTLIVIGTMGGIVIGAWMVTRHDVLAEADKILEGSL